MGGVRMESCCMALAFGIYEAGGATTGGTIRLLLG